LLLLLKIQVALETRGSLYYRVGASTYIVKVVVGMWWGGAFKADTLFGSANIDEIFKFLPGFILLSGVSYGFGGIYSV
jgi:hypothetical protein